MAHRHRWPALAVLLAVSLVLRPSGIWISPDGSAYWQGAISIAAGHGYRYWSGTPILDWPPMYSLYLALFARILGPTGLALVIGHAVLVGAEAAAWTALTPSLWTAVYAGLFVGLSQGNPLAHVLVYVWLPLLLCVLDRDHIPLVPTLVLLCLLVSTHYLPLAFVGAVAIIAARQSLRDGLILGSVPIALVIGLQLSLGQWGRHVLGFHRFSWLAYLLQSTTGIGLALTGGAGLLAILACGALAYGSIRAIRARQDVHLHAVIWLSLAFTVGLFLLTWVYDPLRGRFVYFVPLSLLPRLLSRIEVPGMRSLALVPVLYAVLIQNPWRLPALEFLPAQTVAAGCLNRTHTRLPPYHC